MKIIDATTSRIEELCNERGITINQLAYISGVSNSTIKNLYYGKSKNPGIVTIKKLCDGLEISIVEFFNNEKFYSLEQEIE